MKIGIVCYPTFGGSGVVATELGKALALRGHDVHFITYSQPVRLDFFSDKLFYHEVSVFDYPLFDHSPYETALTSKLVDVMRYEKLDLIHVHYAIPHASVAFMAREILKANGVYIPFITTLHGTDITLVGKNHSYEPVVTFAINESDGVTSVSQNLKENTFDHFAIHNEIVVIPNFVDLKRFSRKAKEHFRKAIAPFGEKLIVHTSNFRKVKRIDHVVKIFDEIRKKIPAKLLLIGDGPERTNIEELSRSLDACNDIRFLGKQDSIEEILSVSDLFILPSASEAFGLSALEAMACEVPVISSDAGGIPEVNIQGVTGFLSTVGNIEEMAKNAIYILENEERHLKFRENALKQAKKFDLNIIVKLYEDYYIRVIEKAKLKSIAG
jgi:N-acetyl-alpha-D-glucosaminyl L-malate synthase BshA